MRNFSILAVLLIVASLFMLISLSEGAVGNIYGSYTWKGEIDCDCYYDADSIKYISNNIIRYWEKCEYSSNPGKGNLFYRTLSEMNCSDSTVRGVEFTSFERSGNVYASQKETGRWLNIIPDTGPDKLFKILCKRK